MAVLGSHISPKVATLRTPAVSAAAYHPFLATLLATLKAGLSRVQVMANRSERRGQNQSAGRYRTPNGLQYNEFVGKLGPSKGNAHTELHVRYGQRDGQYLDWSIALWLRVGGIEEIRRNGALPLERRRLETVEVKGSAIRQLVFDPDDPSASPKESVLTYLSSGDHVRVDAAYDQVMHDMSIGWAQKHEGAAADRHTQAVFAFAQKERDPEFRSHGLDWVSNTLISLAEDQADEAIVDRGTSYFNGRPTTAGIMRANGRMQFIKIGVPRGPGEADPAGGDSEKLTASGALNMGMLVDSIYADQDWADGVDSILGDDRS